MTQMMQRLAQMQQDFEGLLGLMGSNVGIFERVPPGLDHDEPLVDTMHEQRENYDSIASLPDFRLFTRFVVVPGLPLVLMALVGLLDRRAATPATVEGRPVERVPELV